MVGTNYLSLVKNKKKCFPRYGQLTGCTGWVASPMAGWEYLAVVWAVSRSDWCPGGSDEGKGMFWLTVHSALKQCIYVKQFFCSISHLLEAPPHE